MRNSGGMRDSAEGNGKERPAPGDVSSCVADINFFLDLAKRWQGYPDVEMKAAETAGMLLKRVAGAGCALGSFWGINSGNYIFQPEEKRFNGLK